MTARQFQSIYVDLLSRASSRERIVILFPLDSEALTVLYEMVRYDQMNPGDPLFADFSGMENEAARNPHLVAAVLEDIRQVLETDIVVHPQQLN